MSRSIRAASRLPRVRLTCAIALSVALVQFARADAPTTRITGTPPGGIVRAGEPVRWQIDGPAGLHYTLRRDGVAVLREGDVDAAGPAMVEASLDGPGWLRLDVAAPTTPATQRTTNASVVLSAGVIAEPSAVRPAAARPADFDAFWRAQVARVTAIPPNPVERPADSGVPGVRFAEVTLDSIDGHHVRAAIARPDKGERFPAVAMFQYAGVYPLLKTSVTNYAAQGWLAMNISAHDLPLYEPQAYYDAIAELKSYTAVGNESRETSYFRRMLLADYQALEYLARRPDWDGRVLVVRGGSQGGMQAIAMAALHPRPTALVASVPAGADTLAAQAGRSEGWPNWDHMRPLDAAGALDPAGTSDAILNTSRYFDIANFAPDVHCPALICVGLRDTTSPPLGVIATYNAIPTPKELAVMVDGTHTANHQEGAVRSDAWMKQLLTTGAPPTTQLTVPTTRPAGE